MKFVLRMMVCTTVMISMAGCGGGTEETSVTGIVSLDGTPIENAKVQFIKAVADGEPESYATFSDDKGVYSIPRLPAGDYLVVVKKFKSTAPKGKGAVDDAMLEEDPEQAEASGLVKNTLPRKYARDSSTDLKVTVVTGANEDVKLELTGGK